MKKNEIALILVVVGLVVLSTYGIINIFFAEQTLKPVDVDKSEEISSVIENGPSKDVFNKDAINPAVTITIGDQANQQPFTP